MPNCPKIKYLDSRCFLFNLLTWPPVLSQQELCNLQDAAAATSMDNGPLSCIRQKQPRLTFSAPLLIHVPCNFISCLSGNAQFLKRLQNFRSKIPGHMQCLHFIISHSIQHHAGHFACCCCVYCLWSNVPKCFQPAVYSSQYQC